MVKKFLQKDVSKRPSALELLRHEWLSDITKADPNCAPVEVKGEAATKEMLEGAAQQKQNVP